MDVQRGLQSQEQSEAVYKSIFSQSKLSLFDWSRFIYRFSQGLRLRQIDMMMDEISRSPTSLSKMAKKLRELGP
ncbi:unnamed protein product [Boreogadus saida]